MDGETIPMDWVEGPNETTLWLWTETPDPVTVRLDRERWEKLRETAEEHTDGDVAEYVTRVIEADVEDHEKVLGD